jgi:alkylation response protein AidB-like acyl-CoA dehydrogenase
VAEVFAAAVDDGLLDLPLPGSGQTADRFAALAALAEADPVLARLGEGHADAAAILAELGGPPLRPGERWGVWAAVPRSLTATREPAGWRVDGERPWCSGAGCCTHALVTAATAAAPGGVRLFAVPVRPPGASPVDGTWPAVGMARSDSRTVRFDRMPAEPVGDPEEYVERPGFWHGAAGVAACWYGGAVGVARTLLAAARDRDVSPHALAHLGAVDAALTAAWAVLAQAAETIDADPKGDARRLARRVRAVVEAAATEVLDRVGRALGAGPLSRDGAHASRVADLTVYLRQSHAEADLAGLGELVADGGDPRW